MKVSDYIAAFLSDHGVELVFLLTGGGSMHLNDALGHHSGISCIYNHHEQASAIAAESYARITGRVGVINVTTGPGGINALTGVFGSWTDSIPMLVLSGQVRRDTILSLNNVPGLRQLGDQEADVLAMVRGITKYAKLVTDPQSIRFHLEKALHLAMTGRKGPVWLDIPVDVQGSKIDPEALVGYFPETEGAPAVVGDLADQCRKVLDRLVQADRPVIMVGSGIRLADAMQVFERVIRKLGLPVTTAWTAIDVIGSDDPLYCGRPGAVGDRSGNFTVQNSDALLVIGCRLAIRQVSYNWASFARAAYKMVVDIDPAELAKPMSRPDLPIVADARLFLEELERQIDTHTVRFGQHGGWLAWCKERVARYPVLQPEQKQVKGNLINPYFFLDRLFNALNSDDVVPCANASASVIAFQVGRIKKGQRVYTNAGCAAMGYELPAAIGAAAASPGKRVICLSGDGSFQLNLQELQTIAHYRMPVKLFVLNNNGYLSIRQTQGNFFRRFAGEGPDSGVTFPDTIKLATAYGLAAVRIEGEDFEKQIHKVLAMEGPVVCDVMVDPSQGFEPKLSARQLPDGSIVSASLEDMAPFLSRDELAANMLIPPLQE